NSKENLADKEAQNLDKVSQAVRESFSARLELKEELDVKLTPIEEERARYQQIIDLLKSKLAESSREQVEHEEDFFGEKVKFVMNRNGQYQEFVGGESINFLSWAIAKKKGLTEANESPSK
ncbi:hypothetical protein IT411_01270, partial [Candidatus Peregrinibacteria bacterium]|nr:hypothetical protein [Candidatus Peregrinibacteria bacterium]